MRSLEHLSWRTARKLVVLVIGTTVLLLGALAVVLPLLPAVVIIPAGLAILATEFVWARRLLRSVKDGMRNSIRRSNSVGSGKGLVEERRHRERPAAPPR